MNLTKRLVWLWSILMISACQALPVPLPTAIPTITAGPSPTPTPLPTATPLPTPEPVVRIETGDRALFFGDYDSAREQYLAALNDSTDDSLKAAALWGLGRTELADGRYQHAIDMLTQLTDEYPESNYSARAYFLIGQAYYGQNQYEQSAEAYDTYMTRVPGVLDGYVQEYRGDALNEAKDYTGAQNAYNAALTAPRLDDDLNLQIKIAEARASFGDYAGALTLYDQIFATSTNDYIKAQMDYRAGNAHTELGQTDEAYARYLHAVENYPLSYYSYLALVELIDANIAVDDLDRGLVDYYAEQYDVALASFDRYIDANPVNDGSAHYYRALTLRDLQRTQEAIEELDYFINAYSGHDRWADAWRTRRRAADRSARPPAPRTAARSPLPRRFAAAAAELQGIEVESLLDLGDPRGPAREHETVAANTTYMARVAARHRSWASARPDDGGTTPGASVPSR